MAKRSAAQLRRPNAIDRLLSRITLQQTSRDHKALDLVRPFADDHERRVAVVALDGELRRIPVTAMDADGGERNLPAHLGREELRHAGFEVGALARVLE